MDPHHRGIDAMNGDDMMAQVISQHLMTAELGEIEREVARLRVPLSETRH